MTDFQKIIDYYQHFDENNRLIRDASGKLEFMMTMRLLKRYLPNTATILDLGGAAGTYTFPLAAHGYKMYLADLSEALICQAKHRLTSEPNENICSCDVVNAVDLSIYPDNSFDVVLLFGPLYHLLETQERIQCLQEVNRVLKTDGLIFASFIPHLSGSIAIIDRYFKNPDQVDPINLKEVFSSGKFHNNADKGFQEGYYPSSKEIEQIFEDNHFNKICMSSIRGFAYGKEDALFSINDQRMFDEIISLVEQMSETKEIIETCGHAMYIGRKI